MDGGGAIFVRGGRFKVVNCRFFGNRCASTGPDVGGAAIQVFSQSPRACPVYVVSSTFGGSGEPAQRVLERRRDLEHRRVVDDPQQPVLGQPRDRHAAPTRRKAGTPGGGNGGAIYNDGNEMTLHVAGTRIEGNSSNHEGGSAIFFVSNDRSGSVEIVDSVLRNNTGVRLPTHPGISSWASSITFTGVDGRVGPPGRVPPTMSMPSRGAPRRRLHVRAGCDHPQARRRASSRANRVSSSPMPCPRCVGSTSVWTSAIRPGFTT